MLKRYKKLSKSHSKQRAALQTFLGKNKNKFSWSEKFVFFLPAFSRCSKAESDVTKHSVFKKRRKLAKYGGLLEINHRSKSVCDRKFIKNRKKLTFIPDYISKYDASCPVTWSRENSGYVRSPFKVFEQNSHKTKRFSLLLNNGDN